MFLSYVYGMSHENKGEFQSLTERFKFFCCSLTFEKLKQFPLSSNTNTQQPWKPFKRKHTHARQILHANCAKQLWTQ